MSEVLCKKREIWIEGREQTRESQYMVEGRQVYGKGKRHVILGRGKRAYPTLPYLLCSAPITTSSTSPPKAKS